MPLGESMITVLRNNDMLRRVKRRLEHTLYTEKDKDQSLYNLPTATPELLEKIRLKLKLEQQKQTINHLIVFIIVLIFFILIFI